MVRVFWTRWTDSLKRSSSIFRIMVAIHAPYSSRFSGSESGSFAEISKRVELSHSGPSTWDSFTSYALTISFFKETLVAVSLPRSPWVDESPDPDGFGFTATTSNSWPSAAHAIATGRMHTQVLRISLGRQGIANG